MQPTVKVITTPFVLHITVNCYLVRVDEGFILIDTAKAGQRQKIEYELVGAGCYPGNLKLIVLTHGDFDHCGNAAYLRKKFKTKVAMHYADLGMVDQGDMFWNRQQPNRLVQALTGLLFRLSEADRFKPDCFVQEGNTLAEYGLDAQVIELPGHSRGNIGILTTRGELFCGDLLANRGKPQVWTIIDDPDATRASVEKLKQYRITTVYPGHGSPFQMEQFADSYQGGLC